MRRLSASFVPALAVAVTVALGARPGFAAVAPAMSLDQMARAWMSAVALLADDGGDHEHGDRGHGGGRHREHGAHAHGEKPHHDHDRGEKCGCGQEGCERCAREGGHGAGARGHGARPRGHHGGPGPWVGVERARAVSAKMDEILARLARIEAKLDGRAGGPPRIDKHGPRPPAGGLGPRPEGRPEIPEAVREQARKRMEEGRERMEQARQAFRRMEERIRKLEAEIERLKKDR